MTRHSFVDFETVLLGSFKAFKNILIHIIYNLVNHRYYLSFILFLKLLSKYIMKANNCAYNIGIIPGFVMVRKRGVWGRLCVEGFDEVVTQAHSSLKLPDLGKAVCRAMTFQ